MAKAKKRDPKSAALARDGVLNPNPEAVRDVVFTGNPFFDAKDLVQVRYEMVRRHQIDGIAISDAAAAFGVTRPTFYKAQGALKTAGLAGLLPSRRGPKGGHKVSGEVVVFATELKTAKPEMTTSQCLDAIESRFGVEVHRRSLERALARKKNESSQPDCRASGDSGGLREAAHRGPVRRSRHRSWPRHSSPPRFGCMDARAGHEPQGEAACRDPEAALSAKPDLSPPATSPVSSPAFSSLSPWSPCMPELKVTADHLKRDAYLYVRQSTLRQVAEHGESTQRQYALRDRAIAAGWPIERIRVIDRDLGKSGSSTTARDGFQQLVSEVALGKGRHRHGPGGLATGAQLGGLAPPHRALRVDGDAHSR